jgi:hypothetical protein
MNRYRGDVSFLGNVRCLQPLQTEKRSEEVKTRETPNKRRKEKEKETRKRRVKTSIDKKNRRVGKEVD